MFVGQPTQNKHMQCSECFCEMREEGDVSKCYHCGNIQEKNGLVFADRAEVEETVE